MDFLAPMHLLILAAVLTLIFGAKKIPEAMRGMGEGIRSFKDGMRGDTAQSHTTATVTLTAAPNPAALGQPVNLTAVISPTPTGSTLGTVTFFNGSTMLGTGNVNPSGIAMLVANGLPPGALSLTAAYSGTPSLGGSAAAVAVTVNAPAAVGT